MAIKAIILAAGFSKRLRPITDDKPKCLLSLNGETILDYQLRCLVKCRINQILIVVGYKKDMVMDHVRRSNYNKAVKIIYNDIFKKTDNAYSLFLALKHIKETDSVIILDGDIIFDIKLLKKIIASKHKNVLIADNSRKIKVEDCKVLIKYGYVRDIGKKIKGLAIYNSIIKLSSKFLNKFKNECKRPETRTEWYTEPLSRVLKDFQKEVRVIFTKELLACETDTYKDLIIARKIYTELMNKEVD